MGPRGCMRPRANDLHLRWVAVRFGVAKVTVRGDLGGADVGTGGECRRCFVVGGLAVGLTRR